MIPVITLTTDFGADSPYVAQMKGSILSLLPSVLLVDITHSIPPQDIFAGALVLHDTCPTFPAQTIHVAVVDPGVGTARNIVAVRSAGNWYVTPDNGLLTGVVHRAAPEEIRLVENRELWQREVSHTFHGRDIMAPVAAQLAAGIDAAQLGPQIPRITLMPWPSATIDEQRVCGEVVAVDSFGNLITNIFKSDLGAPPFGHTVKVEFGPVTIRGLSRTYGDQPVGQIVALIGSSNRLEIAEVGGDAARRLGVGRGTPVMVRS